MTQQTGFLDSDFFSCSWSPAVISITASCSFLLSEDLKIAAFQGSERFPHILRFFGDNIIYYRWWAIEILFYTEEQYSVSPGVAPAFLLEES